MSKRAAFGSGTPQNHLAATAPGTWGYGSNSTQSPLSGLTVALGDAGFARQVEDDLKWEHSPYRRVRSLWVQTKGAAGEVILRNTFESCGLKVSPPTIVVDGKKRPTASFDMRVEGLDRVDGKLSTEHIDGLLSWGGMRVTDADYFGLIGVRPHVITGYLLPGWELNTQYRTKLAGGDVQGLYRNKRDGSFTLTIDPENPPMWLNRFGGADLTLKDRIEREARRRGLR